MEGNRKVVINTPQFALRMPDEKLVALLIICGELNYMFNKKRFGLGRGIVILLDEKVSSESFVTNLQDICGAVRISAPTRKCNQDVWNYQLAICEYRKYMSCDVLAEFLDNKKFVPVVVVSGIVPDKLQKVGHIIKISAEMSKSIRTSEFRMEVDDMIKFIRENPDVVARELELLRTSETYKKRGDGSLLFSNLLAASCVYLTFFRSTHTERETAVVKAEVEQEIRRCVHMAEEMEEDYESADAIRMVVNRYFDGKNDFEVFGMEEIDKFVLVHLRSGKAIVYDQEFYYLSELLLKKACGSLLIVVPFSQIKRTLQDEGILMCNRTENANFTIKKVFVTRDGQSFRERVLKLKRDFFISHEGLYLEERRKGECRLGK